MSHLAPDGPDPDPPPWAADQPRGYGPAHGYDPPVYPPPPAPEPPPEYWPASGLPALPSPGYGPAPAYGWAAPPAARPGPSGSAIALTVVSALLSVSCYFTIPALPALVIGIVALVRNETDPGASRRLARTGWIVLGVLSAMIVLALLLGVAALVGFAGRSGGVPSPTFPTFPVDPSPLDPSSV